MKHSSLISALAHSNTLMSGGANITGNANITGSLTANNSLSFMPIGCVIIWSDDVNNLPPRLVFMRWLKWITRFMR